MRRDDRFSYLMLFCALLVSKKSEISFSRSVQVVPLTGRAQELAFQLSGSE